MDVDHSSWNKSQMLDPAQWHKPHRPCFSQRSTPSCSWRPSVSVRTHYCSSSTSADTKTTLKPRYGGDVWRRFTKIAWLWVWVKMSVPGYSDPMAQTEALHSACRRWCISCKHTGRIWVIFRDKIMNLTVMNTCDLAIKQFNDDYSGGSWTMKVLWWTGSAPKSAQLGHAALPGHVLLYSYKQWILQHNGQHNQISLHNVRSATIGFFFSNEYIFIILIFRYYRIIVKKHVICWYTAFDNLWCVEVRVYLWFVITNFRLPPVG